MRVLSILALAVSSVLALRRNVPIHAVQQAATQGPPAPISVPATPSHQSVVNPLIAQINPTTLHDWIVTLTQFPDRYYQSQNGVKAAQWIASQAKALPVSSSTKLTVSFFNHTSWLQPSVIARYESAAGTTKKGIVITGSHFDTIAYGGGNQGGPNPAADDCASGSGVVFEALRTLVTAGFVPDRPIEFHWYAAEEEGIYGSNAVAESYATQGISVVSYLNLDQSGYVKSGTTEQIGIMTDYTTSKSTSLMRNIVSTYSSLPQVDTACGYACTDNSAWYSHGYETGMAFESSNANAFPYNDQVNSDGSALDTVSVLSFTHIREFVKTTIGYVVELSLASDGSATTTATTTAKTTTTATTAKTSATTTTTATTCAHDKCKTGAALKASCDSCVAKIIAADSFCGSSSWDSVCVGEVNSVCGITC